MSSESRLVPLLCLPLELRHEIYIYCLPRQIHVRLVGNALCTSTCLEPDKDKWSSCSTTTRATKAYDGWERGSHVPGELLRVPRAIWARRLESTWGPHWKCEEDLETNKTTPSLMLTCKKIYIEACAWMARTATIHLTDLNALARLSHVPALPPHRLPAMLSTRITHLRLVLRMPLPFFHAAEAHTPARAEQHASPAHAWTHLPSTLASLRTLSTLTLWLDHSDPAPWSVLNEQALLTPLLSHLPPNIKITVILPLLHPIHAHPKRHFLPAHDLAGHVCVVRKLRQRYRRTVDPYGDVDVVEEPDFPLLQGLWGDEMTAAEEEAWERELWMQGGDVEEMFREMVRLWG